MVDQEYDKKFNDMQKYLPFLQKIIEKLKINNNNDPDNPRKAQLQKMEMLHSLLTSKGKKLKMETLLKCEGVLIKLHTKMENSNTPNSALIANKSTASESKPKLIVNTVPIEIVDITGPSSPPASPQTMMPARPIEIPTERRSSLTVIESTAKTTKSTNEDLKKTHHEKKYHHRHHHKDRFEYNSKSRYEVSEKLCRSRDTTFDSSTSSKSTSSSHLSELHDINRQQFRNPDRYIYDREHYSWHRKNVDYSQLQHKTDISNQPKPLHATNQRVISDSAYSPEESWDEIEADGSQMHNSNNIPETVPSIAVVDLLNDSPPPSSPSTAPYDTIIFKYKKRESDIETQNQEKKIFSRLGEKVDCNSKFQNFSINVINDRIKVKKDHTRKTPAKTNPLLCTKLPQPPLADVLKSPPLTANDISQLLDETVETSFATESFTTSISSIGTRRPAKTEATSPATAASSLDMVRKKFAMITKNSPQFNNDINSKSSPQRNDVINTKNSPQFNDSPASPIANLLNTTSAVKPNSTQNERLALKYHPHPRVERDTFNSRTTVTATKPSVAPFNVLPAINHFDPRLKKSLIVQPIPSLLDIPISPNLIVPRRNDTRCSSSITPRAIQSFYTGKEHYEKIVSHLPRSVTSAPKQFKNTKSQFQNSSPEECWDTDPEDSSTAEPVKSSTPNLVKADFRNQVSTKPNRHNFSNEPHSPVVVKTKEPQKSGYSSEENWDSDPDTPVTAPQSHSAPQPNSVTQPNSAPRPTSAPQPTSAKQATSAPVAKLITLLKSDPRLQHGKAAVQASFTDQHASTSAMKPSTEEYRNSKTKSTEHSPQIDLHIPSLGVGSNYQLPSNSTRFSALLNDKTERQKYLESKKQKHIEPRTYPEFKQAKARAAAEKTARIANEESPKENTASSSVTQNKQTTRQRKESKDTMSNKAQNEMEKAFETKPLPASNLDKLYRGANFTRELPKSMAKFKIPKKQNLAEEKDSEKKDEIGSIDNNLNPPTNAKNVPEKSEVKDNSAKKVEKCIAKTNEGSVVSITEKRSAISITREVKSNSINEQKTENKPQTVNEVKESNEVSKLKSIDDSEESKTKLDAKELKKDLPESSDTKVIKDIHKVHESKDLKKTTEKTELGSEWEIINEVQASYVSAEETETQPKGEETNSNVSAEKTEGQSKGEKTNSNVSVEETEDQPKGEQTNSNIKSPSNISKSKINDMEIKEIPSRGLNASGAVLQPQRILRRRCTMIAYASAPEVDKEKIHSANALLFEDVQEREKNKRKAEEQERQALRRSKNLADIFQKTDDNCTVSTQNIIIGKRRTRTTVNFNEVQQTQAVFKHIKQKPAEVKKELKTDRTSKTMQATENSINATSAETKKLPAKRKSIKAIKNKNEKEDQSCTVSSTTWLTDETPTFSGNVSASARKSKTTIKAAQTEGALDNEPSSSAKSTNPTPTPLDEDNQELLEGFMKDMVKPNANTKFVLNLLSQILKPKQLQEVKKIVESAAKVKAKKTTHEQINEENDEDDDDDDEESEAESDTPEAIQELRIKHTAEKKDAKNLVAAKKPTKQINIAVKKKRTSELDRLNEDIRDMFISQGVITATGRRMCTLAAAAEAGIKTEINMGDANNRRRDEKMVNKKIKSETKDNDVPGVFPPRIRKSKVIISPINLNCVRRSIRVKGIDSEEDNKTINNEKTYNETEAATQMSNQESPERKMPVLKPNTPIKLSDEEQLEEIEEKLKTKSVLKKRKVEQQKIAARLKPCPKSKKTTTVMEFGDNATSEDSEEDIQLSHLRKRLKSSSKNSDEDDANEEEVDSNENVNLKSNNGEQKAVIGNTNSHWHSQSKYAQWCVICDAKFEHIALHYKVQHNNAEYYSSRIAPNILQQYKQGKLSTPIFGSCRPKQKSQVFWFYRCPFCLQHNRNMMRSWVDHFSKHTGEYLFECSLCHKAGNIPALIEKHIESNQCAGASVIRHQYPINQKLIKAHICHLCNYLQLYRINLEHHYIEHHKCDPDRVTVLGYSIILINTDGAEVVDGKKASEMEAAAIEKYTQESLVIVDDDDEVDPNLQMKNVGKQNNDSEVHKAAAAPIEQENDDKIKKTEISNEDLDKTSSENLRAVDCLINMKIPEVIKELNGMDDKKSAVIKVDFKDKSNAINTDHNQLKQPSSEISDLEKMIADVQEEVLAYAAKAEAEEKAREEALHSNIFTTSTRNNTDSPTIDCLTLSLRTIEQEEQLQQQKTFTAQKAQKQLQQSNTTEQKTPVMSIAERLSQRFKDIQVRSVASKTFAVTNDLELSSQQAAANSSSVNSSFSEATSTSGNNLVIAEENENSLDQVVNDENIPDKDPGSEEDDGDWEDIEISESAPSANTSSISAASSCASGASKEKQKKKKIYQSLNRLYSTMAATNKKGNVKAKKSTNFVNAVVSGKKQRGLLEKPNQQSSNDNGTQLTDLTEKPRPLIHNLADLLPDSPCNDPMELVPELAPVEPLQDLNDISALLEANFSSLDAQNILQQLDMVPVTANSICISVEGQQQSIQDALDFVTEQQQGQSVSFIDLRHINEGTIINPNPMQIINRIQNLGYSKIFDMGSYITKFYCLSKNCSFLYSNESIGLENHYLSEHPQIKWNGFCYMCKQQVMAQVDGAVTNEALSITEEFRHMLEQHVEATLEDMFEPEKEEDENFTTDENESKPRIKLRRLTGDCLSSATLTQITGPELTDSPTPSKDIINMTLTDLLNAEPRPLNLKSRPEIIFLPINKINNPPQMEKSESTEVAAKPMALFTNIGKEFEITSVSSTNTNIAVDTSDTPTAFCPLQISNVVSLGDSNDIVNAVENDSNNVSMSTLPKISNVCSLNSRAAGQKTNSYNAAALWKKQIETDRIELAHAAEESREVSRILQGGRCRSPPTDKLGELLSKALREDSPTVVAETLPTATATSGDFLITQTVSAQYGDNDEASSTEPQLGFNISIAPTSSVISGSSSPILPETQNSTVSDSELPARVQFRCMGTRCTYQTRVVVAMMEHLRFHERRNFSTERQYLRCSLCTNFPDTIEGYFEHAKDQHSQQLGIGVSIANVSGSNATTCALTQKIQYILKGNSGNRTSATNEMIDVVASGSSTSGATRPSAEPTFKQQLEQTIKDMVASTGLPESKVFRCPIKGCTTSLCETSFHKHLIYHLTTLGIINVNNYTYKCPHCVAVYHRPTGIKAHIKSHARHNVFCYMCMATASSSTHILKHFCEKHWKISNILTVPLLVLPNTEKDQNIYLLAHDQQITPTEAQQFGEKLISEWQRKKAASKTHFGFNEINLLPIQPIFQNEVHCAECNYKTKVRTNMFRHLQMHKTSSAASSSGGAQMHVASVDPVNPVPCLNTSERHFDKMCNLASSSLVTGNSSSGGSSGAPGVAVKPPFKLTHAYVSLSRRFTCGVPDCQYLTVSDDIFRAHLSALHSNLQQYLCPFCKEEISTRSLTIERIMQHLRFHSQKLYQCEECDYLHYMKNVVERHIHEKHATQRVNLIAHDRKVEDVAEGTITMQLISGKKFKDQFATRAATAADVQNNSLQSTIAAGNGSTTDNSKNKWECDICKHRTITYNQMISHANSQHSCKQQYQCVHCQFGATQLAHIMTHIDEKHPTKTREARYVFHKINSTAQEKEADTRPLWQRDDPKRIRHIRGILMEDEEESEQYRKLLCLDGELDDEDDGTTVTTNTSTNLSNEVILNIFQYACYHCDYKSSSFAELKYKHWQIVHNVIARDAKPFYFRLLTNLKCAECRQYNGDHNELQIHMQNVHKTRCYVAADGYSQQLECGYCNFKYVRTEQLLHHYSHANHQPQDIKTFTNAHLYAIKFLGTPQTYNQCMICNELFANRMAIVAHERAKHKNDANFSFKEIKNTIIYRCAMCPFTSVDEMTTLRHMIDHYGQFKRCYFCYDTQTTFSSYMQHCYAEHREEVKSFSTIYTIKEITKYLLQIFLIFPNGLLINKKNLAGTKYGRDNNSIRDIYKEICKVSQQPPIPRLSIASLVARKSVEAKNFLSRNNSPNPDNDQQSDISFTAAAMQLPAVQQQAKKISKRRQTVAFGSNECASNASLLKYITKTKKRKISESTPSSMPPPVKNTEAAMQVQQHSLAQIEPYSFYGQTVEPLDLSKIYTKVAIGGLDTQLTIDSFKQLFRVDAQVVVDKLNLNQSNTHYDNSTEYRHIKKACPASLKHKYV